MYRRGTSPVLTRAASPRPNYTSYVARASSPRRAQSPRTAPRTTSTLRPQVNALASAVSQMQEEQDYQACLEAESQQTFEQLAAGQQYLMEQLRTLRKAFASLSDVVLDELDAMKRHVNAQLSEMDARVSATAGTLTQMDRPGLRDMNELAQLRGEIAALQNDQSESQRMLQRNIEEIVTLRSSVAAVSATVGQMRQQPQDSPSVQALAQDVAHLNSAVQRLEDHHAGVVNAAASDIKAVQSETGELQQRLRTVMDKADQAQKTAQACSGQVGRMADALDAITTEHRTLQQQLAETDTQITRLASAADGLEARLRSEFRGEIDRVAATEQRLARTSSEMKRALAAHEDDVRRRFEAVSTAITVFSNVLQTNDNLAVA